ncbi:MAG TPA: DNA polymerase III subunit [Candidatus Limnocylindrales bacterium]
MTGGRQWHTRAGSGTLSAAAAIVEGAASHAVLIVGPPSVGKMTLADDLAAGLLCLTPNPADRPCRACRGCRLVAGGNHPDLHQLGPEGPGGQVLIGDAARPAGRGVRNLVAELAYLPVEGGHRVAIVEHAERMNEDAQNALLKTLEEPPPRTTIILCADEEDRLLPTVRSRCVRLRIAPLGVRAIEELLVERTVAEAPAAARLARIAAGRPGVAMAYARLPGAVTIHDEIARTLLDLLAAPSSTRLVSGRELIERAVALDAALRPPEPVAGPAARLPRGASRSARPAAAPVVADEAESGGDAPVGKRSPAERRRGVLILLDLWRDVALDLAIAALGGRREVRDPALLDDLVAAAGTIRPEQIGAFLVHLDRIAELVEGNTGPELAIDVLVLAWRPAASAAA